MLKKIRFYIAFSQAVIRRDRKNFALAITIILILLFALKVLIPALAPKALAILQETQKPTFVEGVVGVPKHPNPLFDSNETEKDISKLVFRGLMKVDKDGNLVPDLAESYEEQKSKEYIFHLRKGVFWHDGQKFTSEDVVYTIKLAQDQNLQSRLAVNFKDVEVEKVDDYTVKFKLKESFAPFPFATTTGILPEHISLKKYKPTGTGDFKIKGIDKDKITLTSDKLNLVFRFYQSFEDAKIALKMGEIHGLGGFAPQDLEEIEKFGGKKILTHVLPSREAVVFFNTKAIFTKEKTLRQALAFAIDKEQIIKLAAGKTSIASTNQLTLNNWANNSKERYSYNLGQAKTLLKKAGFTFESGSWKRKDEKLNLVIKTIDDKELNTVANVLKSAWEDLGISTKVEVRGVDIIRKEAIDNRQFQILINFQEIPVDPDQYVLWHSTQVQNSNITGIRSPKLDKLLEDARKTSDTKGRKEQYQLFTTLLLDEAPAVFLYYPEYIWVVSDKVKNVDLEDFYIPVDRFNSYRGWVIENGYKFLTK